jgi:hypothetical protein
MASSGVQAPAQAPATHAWLVQSTGVPQVPLALQLCAPLPEHCTWPAVHAPLH